ncbi:hypothetical protein KC878_04490, partial [Candidatus Saccharibacteria bacterium]|nr:hypothetical protein [Candidatus Saccharibacteria bacterium]
MSEKAPISPESRGEQHKSPERHEADNPKTHESENSLPASQETVANLSGEVARLAESSQEHMSHSAESSEPTPTWSNSALRSHTYRNILRSTQRKLNKLDRGMSKIIHRPLVERTSETAAKTIARPTAILTGGVSAFVGSIIVLYYAKRSGFSVGLSLFIILFAGGYLI